MQKTVKDIFERCLPTAKGSEFQVHYRSITFECRNKDGDGLVYFTIPTVFYNMDQEVTSVHIDFHTDDIYEAGEDVKPLSIVVAQSTEIKAILSILEAVFDTVEVTEIADNSFHRHPSRSSFSGTDYDTDQDEPGVIFRKGPCDNLLQTDSVMYHGDSGGELVITESRVVTVSKDINGAVNASYVEIPTKAFIRSIEDNSIRRMLGVEPNVITGQMNSDLSDDNYDVIDKIVNKIYKVLPEPELDFIDEELIKQKISQTTSWKDGWKENTNGSWSKKKDGLLNTYTLAETQEANLYGYDVEDVEEAIEWEKIKEYYTGECAYEY